MKAWIPCVLLLSSGWLSTAAAADDAARLAFFEKKVRPVLLKNCASCHSAGMKVRGGLRLDSRKDLLAGGDSGPAVVPGDADKSLLIQAIRYTGDTKMPPKKQLADEEIADLVRWVAEGAAWPAEAVAASTSKPEANYDKLRKEHWAWQPVRASKPPAVKNEAWPRGDIDRFVLAALEARQLAPVAAADRPMLIRRVTFDLTGLPATPAEIDAFVKDEAADAFEKVVDRLLASPAYGERLGRRWLDVARYGESTGSGRNVPYPHAWRYRDYVIDAFNSDKPYDRFIREQIAGDLLPAGSKEERDELLIATGFLALGVKDVNQRFKVRFVMDNIDEQIDTVTRAVLALTVSCARCHDHKFDPIPTADYYALAGIFQSTDLCAGVRNKMGGGGLDFYDPTMLLRVGTDKPQDPKVAARIEEAKRAFEQARAELEDMRREAEESGNGSGGDRAKQTSLRARMKQMQTELLELAEPATPGGAAFGVRDGSIVGDTEIRLRGEAEKLGKLVPRGFLSVLDVPGAARVNPQQSGRLELAEWLTSPKNPLTARVLANRIWHHLFGSGLVRSVDNFGVTGDAPSHAELLDHLARQFIREGWSVKKLVRSIVLSRTYQLGADAPATHMAADPANRLLWRHAPRRLEAEEIRDAMLAVSGRLDAKRPQGSPAKDLKIMELRSASPEVGALEKAASASTHRSIYLPLLRGLTPLALEVFDAAEQGFVTGSRDATTVATQALYLLNDPLVRQHSQALADRLLKQNTDDTGRIRAAYQLAYGRPPADREIERVLTFLDGYEAAAADKKESMPRQAAWISLCQALLASAEFRFLR